MEEWNAIVLRVQRSTGHEAEGGEYGWVDVCMLGRGDVQKNMYWNTIGCCASLPKLLSFVESAASGTDWRSMRAQVR